MAKCDACGLDMTASDGCTATTVDYPDDTKLPVVKWGSEQHWHKPKPGECCHDCLVLPDHAHHPGCDVEECPKCRGQLISCGCLDAERKRVGTNPNAAARMARLMQGLGLPCETIKKNDDSMVTKFPCKRENYEVRVYLDDTDTHVVSMTIKGQVLINRAVFSAGVPLDALVRYVITLVLA